MSSGAADMTDATLAAFAAGDLVATRDRLTARVRQAPADQQARMFLFQLLCVEGAWSRARAQLRALGELSPEAQMLAAAYGQVIAAEETRAAALAGDAPVPLLVDAPAWAADLAAAFAASPGEAPSLRAAALDACPDTPGEVDGRPFDFLFDSDGRFATTFEAIVGGRWGLVPFASVEEIVTEGPIDLRDTVWLPAEIRFRDGPALAGFLPARYPGTEAEADAGLRLGHRTEWRQGDDGARGVGQRLWTLSNGEDVPLLSFRRLRFAGPA